MIEMNERIRTQLAVSLSPGDASVGLEAGGDRVAGPRGDEEVAAAVRT
jgi:hypothetical protein